MASSLPPSASQPQLIPPKSPSAGNLFFPTKPATSKWSLSSLVHHSGRKGFCLPTHRSSSVPTRSDVPADVQRRPKPLSLPEERSLSATTTKAVFYRISLQPRQKPLRVIVLGQSGVGKTGELVQKIILKLGTMSQFRLEPQRDRETHKLSHIMDANPPSTHLYI